jgi:hypothetical protein
MELAEKSSSEREGYFLGVNGIAPEFGYGLPFLRAVATIPIGEFRILFSFECWSKDSPPKCVLPLHQEPASGRRDERSDKELESVYWPLA